MNGESLHRFDLGLCRHVLDNIRGNLNGPAFAEYAKASLKPAVWKYLLALGQEQEPPDLLLTTADFDEMVEAFDGWFIRPWMPYEALYRQSVDAAREIREALATPYAERWARLSTESEEKLGDGRTCLCDGIQIVQEWVGGARRLLRAIGRSDLLPRPEGTFPTFSSPEPPSAATPCSTVAPGLPCPTPQQDDRLLEMMTEVRDLLVTQKTVKDFYTTEDVAKMLGKAEFTVREWCRAGRVQAQKQGSGRGKYQAWVIAHDELQRLQRDGLLPLVKAG